MKVAGTRGGIPAPMNPAVGGMMICPFSIMGVAGVRASG
jgi:hypothetical protein